MARGVLSGLIWGTVVAGLGAGGLSLAFPEFKPGATPQMAQQPEASGDDAMGDTSDAPVEETAADEPPLEETAQPKPEAAPAEDSAPAEDAPVAEPEPEPEAMASEDAEAKPEDEVIEAESAEEVAPAEEDAIETEVSVAEPEPEADPEPETAEDPAPEVTEEIVAALPEPAGTVGDLAPDVTTGRLPSVTDDEDDAVSGASAVAPPPLERFASDVAVDDSKPLMSIVLIDDGTSGLGFEALESFPYPLTFAVDAAAPNAAERMAEYRSRGLEVVALVSMPQGATASDTEVAMAGYIAAVPEAVAVLEDPDASLQVDRDVSDQVIEILQSSGHGIVFQSSGLNTAQKLAVREGVASARVFRDFDGSDQKAAVIRRFLDQAAFRAGQEGGVVMLGRLRAETISALLIWGLADRANRVSLAPVSAVLQKSLNVQE